MASIDDPFYVPDGEPFPDVMNDPSYATNTNARRKSVDEQDTCRICRGEGSEEEPLFYPCKCSGSIKFVHQDCLMEWLSHSQKKHCELCKTPFRFTKLYHPQMPQTLPTPIFLRELAVHGFKAVVTWLRFLLVAFVWLGWLPWSMRAVWRALFWAADGSWSISPEQQHQLAHNRVAQFVGNGTSTLASSSQHVLQSLSSNPTSSANKSITATELLNAFPRFWNPFSQTLNFSTGEPTIFKISKSVVAAFFPTANFSFSISSNNENILQNNLSASATQTKRAPSWLSDVTALQTLTPYSTLNNVIIDTLEGQLITLLVVVVFILVFLIREWVVQQQPLLNPAVVPEVDDAPPPRPDEARLREVAQFHAQLRADRLRQEAQNGQTDNTERHVARAGERQEPRPIAIPRPRIPRNQGDGGNQENTGLASALFPQFTESVDDSSVRSIADSSSAHHSMLDDVDDMGTNDELHQDALQETSTRLDSDTPETRALRKTLEEASRASGKQEWPGVEVFMELWRRADSDPSEVLRIIDREGRGKDLGWVVLAMERLKNPNGDRSRRPSSPILPSPSSEVNFRASQGAEGQENFRIPEGLVWKPFTLDSDVSKADPSDGTPPMSPRLKPREKPSPLSGTFDFESPLPGTSSRDFASRTGFLLESSKTSTSSPNPLASKDIASDFPLTPSSQSSESSDDVANTTSRSFSGIAPSFVKDLESDRIKAALDSTATIEEAIIRFNEETATTRRDQTESDMVNDPETQSDIVPPVQAYASESPKSDILETVVGWCWGEANPAEEIPSIAQADGDLDDEHVVEHLEDEAPFVPMARNHIARAGDVNANIAHDDLNADAVPVNPGVDLNADEEAADPNQAEAVEDAEDLEGIMELIGMQGPIFGLLQNGVFSALLVSITVGSAIWLPYVWGKVALLLLANPFTLFVKLPLQMITLFADTLFDIALFVVGSAIYWFDNALHPVFALVGHFVPFFNKMSDNASVAIASRKAAHTSFQRLLRLGASSTMTFSDSDFAAFSILSHEALHRFKNQISQTVMLIVQMAKLLLGSLLRLLGRGNTMLQDTDDIRRFLMGAVLTIQDRVTILASALFSMITGTKSLGQSMDKIQPRHASLNYELAYWDTKDRILTILLGYMFFTSCGLIYLRIARLFSGTGRGQRVEGIIADVMQQAGGVMKVILIIGIEMIVFPLYCGLLLDAALLPLFENVTLSSRVQFTIESPCTSLFVHWFIGTCYMFHFALFVSMCRKIMRSGVLYFIRDPDDPTFHPVRDVLERNISTQLRKIAFSALVYGGLVIICLGGVVWGLAFAFDGVLPIHWSSNEPVLEFPVDLLFYNFLMPLAVRFIRPSDGLHTMYNWWFHKCARFLRISEFLFGERKQDEEGHHVRRTWADVFTRKQGDVEKPVIGEDRMILMEDREKEAYFLRDGRFVRAPASDQVRIPKGGRVFLEVDENNERTDSLPDHDDGLHGKNNEMFKKVYIPPYFKMRIVLLILLIWVFAATTGIGATVLPLVLGRRVFSYLLPPQLRMNDVYAFSIGIYLVGGALYGIIYSRTFLDTLKTKLLPYLSSPAAAISRIGRFSLRLLRLAYIFAAFIFLLPSLVALLMELYVLIPIHTYFSPGDQSDAHVIHFIQDWTLGVLYVRMIGRAINSYYPGSRPAVALGRIMRNGWLNPDIGLATRGFVLPATVFAISALLAPLALGCLLNYTLSIPSAMTATGLPHTAKIYRYSYPGVLSLACFCWGLYVFRLQVQVWRMKIRDEVYLIGERLHNFGEKRARKADKGKGKAVSGAARVETH